MILSEFEIEYVDRKAIKGQAIKNKLEDRLQESSNPM